MGTIDRFGLPVTAASDAAVADYVAAWLAGSSVDAAG